MQNCLNTLLQVVYWVGDCQEMPCAVGITLMWAGITHWAQKPASGWTVRGSNLRKCMECGVGANVLNLIS